MDLLKRYDRFGWDFAAVNPLSEEEIAWYLHYARLTGAPVLELASGTGRLLCKLAEAGFDAIGLDRSPAMLNIANANAAELVVSARRHIQFLQGDMSYFAFDRQFGLIYIAGNSFRELTERQQRLDCLACVVRRLRDDGVFLMTERRPDPSWLQVGTVRQSDWTEPVVHPETGRQVQRRFELEVSGDGKWITGKFYYRTRSSDGSEQIETCPVLAPIMAITDYLDLFAAVGLSATLYVGYEHRSDDGTDPILCFVCRKR